MITQVVNPNEEHTCYHCCGPLTEGQKYYEFTTKMPRDIHDVTDSVVDWVDVDLKAHETCFSYMSFGIMKVLGKYGMSEGNMDESKMSLFRGMVQGLMGKS